MRCVRIDLKSNWLQPANFNERSLQTSMSLLSRWLGEKRLRDNMSIPKLYEICTLHHSFFYYQLEAFNLVR